MRLAPHSLRVLCVLCASVVAASVSAEPRRNGQTIAVELVRLAVGQKDLHPHEARALETRMRALGEEARRMGVSAVKPLAALLADRAKPVKARAYAAEFLGLNGDPAALKPLKNCALDVSEDPGLRSAALQSLTGVRVTESQKRRIVETALGADNLPPVVRAEALMQLAEVGVADPDVVLRAASSGSLRPGEARDAARAIARSPSPEAAGKLVELLPAVAAHEEGEVEALGSLALLAATSLTPEQGDLLVNVLRRRRGWAAALAARALGRHHVDGAPGELRRALAATDPVVVTEAAEALAAWRDPRGARAIESLIKGLPKDRRFFAQAGPDVPALAERLHAAAALARAPLTSGPETVALRLPEPPAPPIEPPPTKALPPPPQAVVRRGAFRVDGWPGAARPEIRWKGGEARLFERPEPDAPSRRVKLPAGLLDWDESLVWTLETGEAVVRRKLAVEVMDLGPFTGRHAGNKGKARAVMLQPGETLTILGVRAEGECYVKRRTKLFAMECPQFYPGPYDVRRLPVTEWWVRVRVGGGSGCPKGLSGACGSGWLTAAYKPGTAP